MNLTQAQSRYDNMLPPDNDTSASEARDTFLAEQIRTSLDPMDKLIAKHADALLESVESINQVIVVAHRIKLRRMDDLNEWGAALSDGVSEDNERTFKIRELGMSGENKCQLGELVFQVMQEAFAKRCVSNAEGRVL